MPRAPVVDLMAALNESVAAARASRGETQQDATVHEMPAKRAAKKTTAAAKKTAAKKSSAAAKKSASGRKRA